MKNFSAIILATLIGASMAQAGSISLDMRADYQNRDYDDLDTAKADNSRFAFNTLRVDFKGKLSDSVSYRFRPRFNKSYALVNDRDNTTSQVDYAYITNTMGEGMALTVGKYATDMGGIEGMVSSADEYMRSINTSSTAGMGDQYYTGAKFAYTMEGHELALHMANQAADASGNANTGSTATFNQNKFTTGLVYKGKFMEKALTAIASYHTQNGKYSGPGTDDNEYKNTFMSLGAMYDTEMFVVDADYIMNTLGGRTVAYTAGTPAKDDTLSTMQVGFGYKMDQWTPRLKFESSVENVAQAAAEAKKYTYTGMQLAVEYKPAKDDMFRYHAAYWSREKKSDVPGTASTTTTDKEFVIGTRIVADFLK